MKPISIKTDLLAAMAAICGADEDRWINAIIFDPTEMVATDGYKLVRVSYEAHEQPRFAIRRCWIAAAVAAQRGSAPLASGRSILIDPVNDRRVELALDAGAVLSVPRMSLEHHKIPDFDLASRGTGKRGSPPKGIIFDSQYLDQIGAVARSVTKDGYLQVVAWGDRLSGTKFVAGPMTAVLMPVREES